MTIATAILRKEHEAILRMLEVTEQAVGLLHRGGAVAPQILTGLVEFFQLFADRCHHSKEEELLFPLLEQKGLPRDGGPLGVMLYEHGLGRSLMQQMAEAAQAYSGGTREAGSRWAEAARSYIALLAQHIEKENNVLFRAAERLLSEDEQKQLACAFEKVEEEKMGAGTHERLHALMDKLAADIHASARFPVSG